MEAIAAGAAFVGLFGLWVLLPKNFSGSNHCLIKILHRWPTKYN